MKNILGIDIGGSTTKIIGYSGGEIFSPLIVKANDPKASLYGAFGKFMNENSLSLEDIHQVMITGVGSCVVPGEIFGIPIKRIDEFKCVGRGGLFLTGLDKAVVVSMGTGTAFVSANKDEIHHIGGSGVGGGTLLGLSNKMFNVRHFEDIIETAKTGDLKNVDLLIGDISQESVGVLSSQVTASNFGKISDLATNGDLALGVINLVFQTIGVMSVLASYIEKTDHIVLTGNLTNVPQAKEIFEGIHALYGVEFIIPNHSEFATATGAALSHSTEDK